MISFTIINATRILKHIQYAKKEYSSKVKSARERFHSLPMNIVKIIVPSIAYSCYFFDMTTIYLHRASMYTPLVHTDWPSADVINKI